MRLQNKLAILLVIIGLVILSKNFQIQANNASWLGIEINGLDYCKGDSVPEQTSECVLFFNIMEMKETQQSTGRILGIGLIITGLILFFDKSQIISKKF